MRVLQTFMTAPVNFPSSFSVYPGTVPFGAALRRPPLVAFRLLLASTEPALALLMPRAGFASFLRTSLEVPPPPPVFIFFIFGYKFKYEHD